MIYRNISNHYLKMKVKNIKIISLKRETLRREDIKKNWINHKFDIVNAIDGFKLVNPQYKQEVANLLDINVKCLSADWLLNRSNYKTMSSRLNFILPRFGLYLSWIKLLKTAILENLDHVLILESDSLPKVNNIHELQLKIIDFDALYYLGASVEKKYVFNLNQINIEQYWKINPNTLKIYGGFGILIPSKKKILELYRVLKSVFLNGKSYDKHKDWNSGNVKLRCQAIDLFLLNHYQKNNQCYLKLPTVIDHPYINSSTIDNFIFGNVKKFEMEIV